MPASIVTRFSTWTLVAICAMTGLPEAAGQDARFRETTVLSFDGIVVDSLTVGSTEVDEYIIQFNSPPAVVFGSDPSKRGAARAAVAADHDRFEADFRRLKIVNGGADPEDLRVRRRFETVLNAVSVTLDAGTRRRIESLPYVKRVERNLPVRISSPRNGTRRSLHDGRGSAAHSAPRSGHAVAPPVAARRFAGGEGVRIAIVDTGIDWSHPDLGGGIGPGFKIADGHDFVNDDHDPMDDNGHGTHVAGIAAADGTKKGVAPAAGLLAYKVLDATGGGFTDVVIAGIERAMDPDGDGSFSDAADIINLSLGADPYFIDTSNIEGFRLLNEVIENATEAGVLVVVAAGNSGDALYTIGYPANAEAALTVGALDEANHVAFFSSRGPAPGPEYSLKPDVVAPGENVTSTWPGGGHQSLSGTSMAAPYAAGVAANLFEEHPDWGPLDVKSAMVHTAEDLGEDPWVQGAGRIRQERATTQRVSATASLNFGLISPDESEWTASGLLRIRNLSDLPANYSLSPGTLPPGVTVTVEPVTVQLQPGEIATPRVHMSVDDALPDRADVPYVGEVHLADGPRTVQIPVAFLKSGYLDLRLFGIGNSQSWYILDESGEELVSFGLSDSARVLLERGAFRVLAVFGNQSSGARSLLYEPAVTVDPTAVLVLDDADSEVVASFRTIDEHGMEYPTHELEQTSILSHEGAGLLQLSFSGVYQLGGTPRPRSFMIRSSGFESGGFRLDWILRSTIHDETQYVYKASITDFSRMVDIPGESIMVPYSIRHELPADVEEAWFQSHTFSAFLGSGYAAFGNPDYYLTGSFERKVVEMPDPVEDFPDIQGFSHFYELYDVAVTDPASMDAPSLTVAPSMRVRTDGSVVSRLPFWSYESDPVVVPYAEDEAIVPERGPYTWLGRLTLGAGEVSIATNTSRGLRWYARNYLRAPYLPLFASQSRAIRPGRARWILFNDEERPVAGGDLGVDERYDPRTFERHSFDSIEIPDAGPYDLEISSRPYFVRGAEARTYARYRIDSSTADREPPTMKLLRVFDASGRYTDSLEPGSSGRLLAGFSDETGFLVERVAWRTHGSESWDTLQFSVDRGLIEAELPAGSSERYVDIQIEIVDIGGNRLVYEARPAIIIGNPPIPSSVDDPAVLGDLPTAYALGQNWPNPFRSATTIEFDLPRTVDTRILVYDMLGRQVATLTDELMEAGTHRIGMDGLGLSPGVYFYVLDTPDFSASRSMIVAR